LSFAAREVTAIVGRTGAGKTSLLLAVLQLVPYEGSVEVDGLPLSSVQPEVARRRLVGAVPQQPLLFAGDVRWNLDPEGQWTDDELWAALEAVGLKSVCAQDPRGLSTPLVGREQSSSGTGSGLAVSLSQGQRQLLCAARVLLRKQRVVMLDEVTSTLPQETAVATLQDMVDRFKASDATVLLVTHQEEVTSCCERIVTVADGRVVGDERRESNEELDFVSI